MLFHEKVAGLFTFRIKTSDAHVRRYPVIMPSFFQHLSWGPLRTAMRLFCSFEIKGIENVIGLKGGVIIASNHISELDPLLISACLPFFSKHLPLFYVSREKSFYKKSWRSFLLYGGTFFRMMGAYPAYTGLNDYRQALRHHIVLIQGIENFSFAAFLSRKRKLTITFGKPLSSKDIFETVERAVADSERNDCEKAASVLMEKIFQLA